MLEVSEQEIRQRLAFDNPWWGAEGRGRYRYQSMPRRFYFDAFFAMVRQWQVNRAVVLMGPRRVGKTVLVHHAIYALLEAGVAPADILYLSLETPVYTGMPLEKLLRLYLDEPTAAPGTHRYVFFDEIQYLKDWEVHLKSLVDSWPDIRFVATGSAAAALRLKSAESGAGRFSDFVLPPLSFAEYLHFIGKDALLRQEDDPLGEALPRYVADDLGTLNSELVNYLNYGGYPEAVLSEMIQKNSPQYIKSDIIEKVLLRDLPSLYGIQDIQELNRLFTVLAYNTGQEVSIEALSRTSGVAKNTLRRYLEYLEAAFLIRRINRVDENAQRLKRITSFKVYLTNPSMRSALFGNLEPNGKAMGVMVETALFAQWMHSNAVDRLHYARWSRGEVDIVSLSPATQAPWWCVEVKWSDRHVRVTDELNALVEFYRKHTRSMQEAPLVTSISERSTLLVGDIPVRCQPAAELIYTVGRNILREVFVR